MHDYRFDFDRMVSFVSFDSVSLFIMEEEGKARVV